MVRTSRLSVGIVGAGRAAQAAHLPALSELPELFEVKVLAEPVADVCRAVAERYRIPHAVASLDDLLQFDLDVLICATRVPWHAAMVTAALDAGLHVLCEKPLAFTDDEIAAIVEGRDRADRVVQVGYMKRFDPGYERLLELLPDSADELRYVSIEVNDPNQGALLDHVDLVTAPAPPELAAELESRMRAQVRAATGQELDEEAFRAYVHGFVSSMAHDVNLLHGVLERVGHRVPADLDTATIWAGGAGVRASWRLDGGGLVNAVHLNLPGVNHYRERLTVYAAGRILELTFGSPYLRHQPARLVERRSDGAAGHLAATHRPSNGDAFRQQLVGLHGAITRGDEVRTPPEQARLDLEALQAAHAWAAAAPRDEPARPTYDRIGRGYAELRREDPRIAARLHDALGGARRVVNVGAGTGSYEPRDREVTAVEPSEVMVAQRPRGASPAVRATAEALPFADGAFDAAMAVLTLHHWDDPRAGLREMRRVATDRVVVLTWDPAYADAFWLVQDYLPELARADATKFLPPDEIAACLGDGVVERVPVPHDCTDAFVGSHWRRPEAYLDERFRRATSVFDRFDPELLRERLDGRLADDLRSGAWQRRHGALCELDELDLGYCLVVAGR